MREFVVKIMVVLLVGGGALAWFGFRDFRLALGADAVPRVVTCRALGDAGPLDNAHVRMTDFTLVMDSFVVETRLPGGGPQMPRMAGYESWDKAWVPAVPADHEYAKRAAAAEDDESIPLPADVRVIVQLGFTSNRELDQIAAGGEIHGTVINEIDSLDDDVRRLLRTSYPGVDVDRCWILESGREPSGRTGSLVMLVGGLILIVGGAVGLVAVHRDAKRELASDRSIASRRARTRRTSMAGDAPAPRRRRR